MENNFQPNNPSPQPEPEPRPVPAPQPSEPKPMPSWMPKLNKNTILISIAVLVVIITGGFVFASMTDASPLSFLPMSKEKIAQKSIDYLNSNVLQGQTATLGEVTRESGVIKIQVKIGENDYTSYITKDGKLFFPEAFDIKKSAEPTTQTDTEAQAEVISPNPQVLASLTKVDKPLLETYVVSRCPFGLQIQRAIADAVSSIPDLASYITVRYIGEIKDGKITAMHGDAEAQENFRQICIREEQADKYWPYVACQMQSGDTAGCQSSAGVNAATLGTCMSTASRGLAYAKEDFDLTTKYNIQGSPTTMLNRALISESDFGGRSSESIKTMVCASSKNAPGFCATQLNTSQAASSFSTTYSTAGALNNSANNCAPAQG